MKSASWCARRDRRHLDFRDVSDNRGLGAVIELKRGEMPDVVLKNL